MDKDRHKDESRVDTSHQKLFLPILHFISLLLFVEGRHARGGPVGEEAPLAAVPHLPILKHAALLLLFLLLFSGGLRGGVAGVKPAAPRPSPPLGLVVDADLAALLLQRSWLLIVTVMRLLLLPLFLPLKGICAVVC